MTNTRKNVPGLHRLNGCMHMAHTPCAMEWARTKAGEITPCPLCRRPYSSCGDYRVPSGAVAANRLASEAGAPQLTVPRVRNSSAATAPSRRTRRQPSAGGDASSSAAGGPSRRTRQQPRTMPYARPPEQRRDHACPQCARSEA
jgi:hypothetical protein